MERLLKKANEIEGKKFNIESFAKITEAIHVIRTEMGITGTTAKEASETIRGSIQGMQSAIGNLMAGLGDADADISMLMGNVVEAFRNVMTNIVPVIKNIANALPEAVVAMIGAIGELLITIMSSLAQEESRSISENVTWGQRKRMAKFCSHTPNSSDTAKARTACLRLCRRKQMWFGLSSSAIAKFLKRQVIPTPAGKENRQA